MGYTRNTWIERVGQNLNRWRDTISNVIFQFVNEPTSVSQEGSPVRVDWLNNMEEGILDAHNFIRDKQNYTTLQQLNPAFDMTTPIVDIITAMVDNSELETAIESGTVDPTHYPEQHGTLRIVRVSIFRVDLLFSDDGGNDHYFGVYHQNTGFSGWRTAVFEERANTFIANQGILADTPRFTMQDNSDPNDIKFFQAVIFQGGLYFLEDSETLGDNPRGHAPLRIEDGIVYLDNLRLRQTGGRLESSVDGTTWRRVGMATPGVNDLDTGKVTLTSTTSFVTAKRLPAVGNLTEPAILRRVRSRYNGNSTNAEVRITIDGQVLDTGRVVTDEDYVYIDNFGEIQANQSILIEHRSGAFNESIITQWDIQDSNV